jgi:hypothetical protein
MKRVNHNGTKDTKTKKKISEEEEVEPRREQRTRRVLLTEPINSLRSVCD